MKNREEKKLTLVPIRSHTKESKFARLLFDKSFPRIERIPFQKVFIDALKGGSSDFWCVLDKDTPVAAVYMMRSDKYAYVFYMAVVPDQRCSGYGTALLKTLKKKYEGRELILDIEAPEEGSPNFEQRARRRNFYLGNGFSDTGWEMQDVTGHFRIFSQSGKLDKDEFLKFYDILPYGFEGTKLVDLNPLE